MELPATPSKSKLPGRPRFCSLTTLLVLFALMAGARYPARSPRSADLRAIFLRRRLPAAAGLPLPISSRACSS